jgi:hypothetical protein
MAASARDIAEPPPFIYYPSRMSTLFVTVAGATVSASHDAGAFGADARHYIDSVYLAELPVGAAEGVSGAALLTTLAQTDGGPAALEGQNLRDARVLGKLTVPLQISLKMENAASIPLSLVDVHVVDGLPVPLHVSTKTIESDIVHQDGMQRVVWGIGRGGFAKFERETFPERYHSHPFWQPSVFTFAAGLHPTP